MINIQAQNRRNYGETGSFSLPTKQTSMRSLIIWNISKALEENPSMDLRHAMRSVHERLERESRDESGMIAQPEWHLTCALLAWQQLGHKDTDSLYQFIEENRKKSFQPTLENLNKDNTGLVNKASISSKQQRKDLCHKSSEYTKDIDSLSFDIKSLMGPVVKLPVETKIIMRSEYSPCSRHSGKKISQQNNSTTKNQNDIKNKIDAACCMDSACLQRLAELDTAVCELRSRAARLARREAERVELLERAEAAWKDLELGYQRRLNLAEEKEDDLAKQIKKIIDERNGYKGACTKLAEKLKERGEAVDKERTCLTLIEKDLCDIACVRLRLSEETARGDTALAEEVCRANQMDRDRQFKEDQVRRKVSSLDSEIQSARCLTQEAECAMRAELAALKEQVTQVSNQLLAEESECNTIKIQLQELRKEKDDLIEDLDGCKLTCDNRMQGRVNELKQKREELMRLKEKVIECRCKIPQDVAIEVKRTPSLAALCQCNPEDKLLESCSCTSLRTQLLSNLLADLFGGLQSELGESGSLMPCQLLKCLEDKHNWDRSSVIKTNLRNFFEQLLVGELDIAIATSIDKYHAKWVGASCADQIQLTPDPGDTNEGWQERAIERKAQKLATKLAEQLFQERAEQVTKKAKEIVTKGPPPCECKTQPAVYQCLVKRPITLNSAHKNTENAPLYFKRTIQDVTQLKVQVENLKKRSVKKEDLRHMEEKIVRILKQSSDLWNITQANKKNRCIRETDEKNKQNTKILSKINMPEKKTQNTRQSIDESSNYLISHIKEKSDKLFKKNEQSYAVNLCLCGAQNGLTQENSYDKSVQIVNKSKNQIKTIPPVTEKTLNIDTRTFQFSRKSLCPSNCVCFHKIPSNTSIEKLLQSLLKWNGNINSKSDKTILCNERKVDQINNVKFNSNLRGNIKNDTSALYSINDGIEKNLNSFVEDHDKGTNYDILPNTTESEYIGAINLDKSNDNFCKHVSQNCDLKCCDGQEMPYGKKPSDVERIQDSLNNYNVDFKKESKVYSMKVHRSKYGSQAECADKLPNPDNNASKRSLEISGISYVDDVLKKSDLVSSDCDYCVKFLGVTLANAKATASTKKMYQDKIISTVKNFCKENSYNLDVKNACELEQNKNKPTNSELQNRSNNYKCDLISDAFYDSKAKSKPVTNATDVIKDNEIQCICCDKEEYNNLELNMLTLLEEHLKEKLVEFQSFSCKSKCISIEEEKVLFSKTLGKIKELLSENLNPENCKCKGFKVSKESWNRAYGLLQEYLKVKMKRIQCACIANNDYSETFFPVILDKVCNLIDDDFQRLREKCKCDNKIIIANSSLKKLNEQMTETQLECKDTVVQFDNCISRQHMKNIENTSTQVLCIPFVNKSCEVIYEEFKSTAEKKVSCELKKGYITDCSCYAISESCYLHDTDKNKKEKRDKFKSTEIYDKTPTKISSISVKDYHSSKNTNIVNLSKTKTSTCLNEECKFKCLCDHKLDICYCTKSLIETRHGKKYRIWNSLSMVDNSKSIYCNIDKTSTENKLENIHINNSRTYNIENIRNYCNVEVMTANNEHEVVLKYSKEGCCNSNITSDVGLSVANEFNKENSSSSDDCNYQSINDKDYKTDAELNKSMLFNSLYLPTEQLSENSKYKNFKENYTKSPKQENCECKMVPLCHVKMLVESIEQKLVQAKCTCDSFCSQVCPIQERRN